MTWWKVERISGGIMSLIGYTSDVSDAFAMCYSEHGVIWRITRWEHDQ